MMVSGAVYGAFIILITISYLGFISALNFPFSYKILLYLPALFFLVLFLFLGLRNRNRGESGQEVGGFPYQY
jgi:ABC-type multidrug transport system permease subunit